jgi:hypothetical protein
METAASFEVRNAPSSYPTAGGAEKSSSLPRPSVRCCRCRAAIAGRLGVRSADSMHELQQVFHNPVTWHILANQVLLTATLVGFDHFEAIEGASHGSCIAINAVKIAQDEDIHLGSEETRNGLFRPSDDRFLFVEACV